MSKPSGWSRKRKNTAAERARAARYADPEYRQIERVLKAEVQAGRGYCWRCQGWIDPRARTPWGARAWHVGHNDAGTKINGAEHWGCNVRPAASIGARTRNAAARTGGGSSSGGPTRVSL